MRILGRALVAVCLFGILLTPSATLAAPVSSAGKIACNGSSSLCDRKLNEVVLPGSHNSMSAGELGWFSPNQTLSIPNQLKGGARAMLIDTYYGKLQPNGQVFNAGAGPGDTLYLCHSSCQFGASNLIDVLREVANFLRRNPNEVLVFINEDKVAPADFAEAVDTSGLSDFLYTGPPGPWPTLGQMIATDQRVVMLAERNADGVPWYHEAYGGAVRETPYSFDEDPLLLTSPGQLTESCRPGRGESASTGDSLFLMNHWISSVPEISGSFAPKIENAEIVNQKPVLVDRARACQTRRSFMPGILAVDFFGTGDVVGAANELNGVLAMPKLELSRIGLVTVAGKRATRTKVTLTNRGDAPARSVKVCASVPKKLLLRPACRVLGELLAGGKATVMFTLRARKSASGSGTFQVIASTGGTRTLLQAKVRVRPGG